MNKIYTPSSLKSTVFNVLKEPFYTSNFATQAITIEGQVSKEPSIYGPVAYLTLEDTEKVQLNVKMTKGLSQNLKRGELVRLLGTLNLNSKPNSIDYDIVFSANELLDRKISLQEIGRSSLIGELWNAGYFSRHKPFPDLSQMEKCRVAIVTSANESAHAFADIEGILKDLPFYNYRLIGVNLGSSDDIARGIAEATINHDIIIVTRGGGDLAVFDERVVLDAIFHASSSFIISAIGHAKDRVLSDNVADHIARTPTDAARILAEKYSAHIAYQQFNQLQKNNTELNHSISKLYKLLEQSQRSSDSLLKSLHTAQIIKVLALIGFSVGVVVIVSAVIRNHGFSWIFG